MSADHFETGDRTIHPVVTLKNGLRVANFSSPHPFTFDDGSVLPACPESTVLSGTLDTKEDIIVTVINGIHVNNVALKFKLSHTCLVMLSFIVDRKDIDIVLVPLPVLECVKDLTYTYDGLQARALRKIRCVRMKDRIQKIIYSDTFCV